MESENEYFINVSKLLKSRAKKFTSECKVTNRNLQRYLLIFLIICLYWWERDKLCLDFFPYYFSAYIEDNVC